MSLLTESEPSNQRLVSELASYIREDRVAINSMRISTVEVATSAVKLTIGTELNNEWLEVVILSGEGAATLATIEDGTEGQIKVLIFQDGNLDLTDGVKDSGKLFLNQAALSTLNAAQDDVLALVNVGGDGGVTQGYWKELFRSIDVK